MDGNDKLHGMMDIIDPAFDGADGIDGDDLLQALSDHEDIMDFHDEQPHSRRGSNGSRNRSNSEPMDMNLGMGNAPDYHQTMAAASLNASNNNSRRSSVDSGIQNPLIGTTVKAPLAPLEPPKEKGQSRGRQRRAPRRKQRSRSNSQDAQAALDEAQPPLFGGGGHRGVSLSRSVQSELSMDGPEAGFRNSNFNDNASACSAPADLFDLGGHGDMGGGNANYDPTAIPDVMDIQKMLIMRGLLDDGGVDDNANYGANNFAPVQIQRPHPQQRRRTVEADLASSQGSQNSQNHQGRRPYRRRKTLDDPLSIFMAGDDNGIPSMEELQNAFPAQNNGPIKRRKSEPLMNIDFWDEGAGNFDDAQPQMNHMGGGRNGPAQVDQSMMNSTFIAAAKEAFDSINRLKELMNAGGMGGAAAAMQGMPMPQQVTSAGNMGTGAQQWQMQQQQQQQQQQQPSQKIQGQPGETRSFPTDFQRQSGQQYRRSGSQGTSSSVVSTGSIGSTPSVGSGCLPAPSKKKGGKKSAKSPPPATAPAVVPQIPLPDTPDPDLLKLDPGQVMAKLQATMEKTKDTQKLLQEWDRAQGLPKSHSQTMVNSSRSRKQLTDGVILKKWNGAPLLNFEKDGQEGGQEAAASQLGQN